MTRKIDIDGFSADYRDAHPQKPKAERPAPKRNTERAGNEKAQPGGKIRRGKRTPRQSRSEENVPRRNRSARLPLPQDRMENDTEIDDFLPAGENGDVESYLTKWDEARAQKPASPKKSDHRRAGKYRYGLFVGFAGADSGAGGRGASSPFEAGTRIHGALTDDSKLRAYDKELAVVVAQDPQPFASPDKADPDFVLNASHLEDHDGERLRTTRTTTTRGAPLCRSATWWTPAASCSGRNARSSRRIPLRKRFITYDSAKAQFHIALYSLDGIYEPYTVSAKKEGDGVVLRVGYIPPTDPTRASSSGVSSSSRQARSDQSTWNMC